MDGLDGDCQVLGAFKLHGIAALFDSRDARLKPSLLGHNDCLDEATDCGGAVAVFKCSANPEHHIQTPVLGVDFEFHAVLALVPTLPLHLFQPAPEAGNVLGPPCGIDPQDV